MSRHNGLPGYDEWKTRTPEEDADFMRPRRRRYRDYDDGPTEESIEERLALTEAIFGKDWPMEGALADDHSKSGIFRGHRCWKCNDGEKPCAQGSANRCEYPRARND